VCDEIPPDCFTPCAWWKTRGDKESSEKELA
jgi:hypothetical protein